MATDNNDAAAWRWVTKDAYELKEADLEARLKKKWGRYNYHVTVRTCFPP
jgi:hypothetical protein